MEKGATGIHWSKDFVEHLRTVHFALMAISLGLIALSLAHPVGPLERALDEIRGVKKIIDQVNTGSHYVGNNYSDWVDEWADVAVKKAIDAEKIIIDVPEKQVLEGHGEIANPNVYCVVRDGKLQYELK